MFLRIAGENLSANLFVPFIEMVRALSCSPKNALAAFNLLKTYPSKYVNWDHFFFGCIRKYTQDLSSSDSISGLGGLGDFGGLHAGYSRIQNVSHSREAPKVCSCYIC